MVRVVKGDLLSTDADIICHQVNLQGYMGGGLALSIAKKFPYVDEDYRNYPFKMLGGVCFSYTDTFIVANCFSQTEDFDTDYDALRKCLSTVKSYMKANRLKTVAIPYKYGCGIANGDWETVRGIFEYSFRDFDLIIYQKE